MTGVERHPGRVFSLIAVAFAAAYVFAILRDPVRARPINGDAIQYYSYLRSIVFDRDVDFRNEYERLYPGDPSSDETVAWLRGRTPTGHVPNMMSIGPALLWSPLYVAAYAGLAVLHHAGWPVAVDGFSIWFQLAAGLAGIAYAAVGGYLCFRAAALLFPARAAFWSTLVAWLASPALYYSLVSPAYSHAVSMFAVALFVFVWLRRLDQMRVTRFAVLGVLAGLAALVRWQDIIVLVLPGVEIIAAVARRRARPAALAAPIVALICGTLVALIPQFLAWHAIYGAYIAMPQGQGFMRWTEPAIVSVLLSLRHGLWTWTPALIPAALGLLLVWRRDTVVGAGLICVFLLSVYINASVSDWWAGEAFGARRFVGDTVIFAVGLSALAAWIDRRGSRRWLPAIAIVLIVCNMLFLLQYQLFMHGYRDVAPYPGTMKQVFVDRFIVPFDLLRSWIGR